MRDQLQRWGYHSSEAHTKYDALHNKDGVFIDSFGLELKTMREDKADYDIYNLDFTNNNPATNKNFKFPLIMDNFTNLLNLM